MKFTSILPLVAASSAFVVPPEQVLEEVSIEDNHRDAIGGWYANIVSEKDHILSKLEVPKDNLEKYYEDVKEKSKDVLSEITQYSGNALDTAFEKANDAADSLKDSIYDASSEAEAWMESASDEIYNAFDDHHHDRPGHKHPHHQKPNLTVYQLIAESKYTTKLAEFINEFDDLVEELNSTKANYTVFAPTDKAFAKIPEHAPKPSKEELKEILSYHVSGDFYPAGRVLASHTIPTLLKSDSLGSEPLPQRLRFSVSLRGLTLNFFSRIIAINIFGTNGVIHGIDTPLLPPFSAIKTIDLFPGGFSTLELGLGKTGLLDTLNTTDHAGGTFFAPNNNAFAKLGPKINAFLFSQYGLKYLKALLEYHVVPDNTLYSDAFYKASSSDAELESIPKGQYHIDLPTLLKDRTLSIDIARFGGLISVKVNGFTRVAVQDVVVEDGVIQVMSDVIVPPKKLGGNSEQSWFGEEMSVEELKGRLEPYMPKSDL